MIDPLPKPSSSALVLVVDDEMKNIQVVGALLLKHGHEVIAATSGADALAKLETAHPDIILLDVMMPGMTGFELCRKPQENPDYRDIPVLFLSAAADKNFVVEALEAGAVDYVTKPFHSAELISRVQLHANWTKTNRQLAETIREKNRFLEIVAHDLKNPLSGIQFAASVLSENSELPKESQVQLIDNILESATRAFEIIGSLLEIRGLEQAKASIVTEPLCLREHALRALKSFDQHKRRKDIAMDIRGDSGRVEVMGESRSLLCCLENLISNAIKFSPRESQVTINVIHGSDKGIFEIEDKGPGIKDEEIGLLFGKFTRLSARPTGGEGSTGMGLHIVHELVTVMGGTVGYQKREGGGARFILELPLAR
jgi:two-component system sensor histidine kinase/response regulator